MIEVEAKVRIPDINAFRRKIKNKYNFIRKEKKIDDYYTLENLNSYPKKSLRIRKREEVYEINFKQKLSYIKGVHVKDEHEFVIRNIAPFIELIEDFGFKRWLRKEKTTELYNIGKNFNIEINYVKKLGWFLEIEYLCKKSEINYSRKKVLEVVKKLGINKREVIEIGYTRMLWDIR